MSHLDRINRSIKRHPASALLVLFAIMTSAYVIAYPLGVTRYVPMTDLPFHAANSGILHHYFDPDYHLREQFVLSPLAVPYMSSYVLTALCMLVMPSWIAVKVSAAVMLALLPLGLAVMFAGMKKSPLLSIAALPFAWSFLTHWGFLNFVGAIGLFCMAIGLALMVLDKPTFDRQWQLSAVLVLLFFTHVFRFPFAILGVLGTTLVMYPATRRVWPVLPPLVVPLGLFAAWLKARPDTLRAPVQFGKWTTTRLPEFASYLLEGGFQDPEEARALLTSYRVLGGVALVLLSLVFLDGRLVRQTKREWVWRAGTVAVAFGCFGAFFLLFLLLPMEIGQWWYIYPREAVAAAVLALGLLPDLPRATLLRVPIVLALGLAPLGVARSISTNYLAFDQATQDFHQITRSIPTAPKLMYLIFDHGGTKKKNTPFIHLPAYVQAEKGGWLGFHFAMFGTSPVLYRDRNAPGAIVPPPVPLRWEWTPHKFRVLEHGPFFDWFLVRSGTSPAGLFRADSAIVPVEHVGMWWLYRRLPQPARLH